jgi:RES domain-containing protein
LIRAWRIIKTKYASVAFDGEGAKRAGGRWTSIGKRAVYTSSTIALATLEMLAHLNSNILLPAYSLIEVQIPPQLVTSLAVSSLPSDWRDYPSPPSLLGIGDAWLEGQQSAVLRVPSAITVEDNYVLNPMHRDFALINRASPIAFPVDVRLL